MVVEFASFNSIVSSSLDKATQPTEDLIKDELISNINHIKKNFYWYDKLMNDQHLLKKNLAILNL